MQMPIPDDWDGLECCRWAVYWPDSPKWLAILHGVLEQPSQGRFWDITTGNIVDTQNSFRPFYDKNFELEGVIMACDDSNVAAAFQAGMTAIANAISQLNISSSSGSDCGCEQIIINQGAGVQGTINQPGSGEDIPLYGTEPTRGIPPGTFPDGYDSEEDYLLDKCQLANGIVDGAIVTLRGLASVGIAQGAALAGLIALAIAGALVFPPAFLPIACAMIGVLSVEVTVLAQVANEIEADRDTWVCTLYANDNTGTIYSLVADLIDAIVTAIPVTGLAGWAVKSLVLLLFNVNTLNQLMTRVAHFAYPDADCSACGCPAHEFLLTQNTEGWVDFTNNGGTTYWQPGQLWGDTPANDPETNGTCGWQYIFGAGDRPIVVAGDKVEAIFEANGNWDTYFYIQADFTDETIAFIQIAGTTGNPQPTTLDLSGYTGKTVASVKLYQDTISDANLFTWSHISFKFCGDIE